TFTWQFLGRSNLVLPVWVWPDPASAYGPSPYFTPLAPLPDQLQPTLLFRPGLWPALPVPIGVCPWGAPSTPPGPSPPRVTPAARVCAMPSGSLGGAAAFRYAFWCGPEAVAGAGAAVLARRDQIPKRASADQRSRGSSSGSASTPRM